ncbi:MAG: hypothetical protein ACR2QF_01780 [Geminicoccaceae bacterium]
MSSDAFLLFTDKNHDRLSGMRRAKFRHVVLLISDDRHLDRWLLCQWRNNREMTRIVLEDDFREGDDTLYMEMVVRRGLLDADMNGEVDLDVELIKVSVPSVRPRRMLQVFRPTDVGYVKQRLGMGLSHIGIRTPYGLYRFFEKHGKDGVEKTARSLLGLLWLAVVGGFRLARRAG